MDWIELHQAIWTHRKTFELAARLDIDETYAAAHVIRFWTWALDNAPSGDVSVISHRAIAHGAGWHGDADMLVEALIGAGWLDPDMAIHDWDEYAGRLVDRRQANAERMRQARAARRSKSNGHSENVQRTNDERAPDVQGLPDRTGPNRTGPEPSPPTPSPHGGKGDAAVAAGGKRRKARTNGVAHDESQEAKPLQEPPLAPADDRDRRVWNLARGRLAEFGLTAGNVEAVGLLVPVGRSADGGLRLRAPPGMGLARFGHHVARALSDAGDQHAERVTIFESLPDSEGS